MCVRRAFLQWVSRCGRPPFCAPPRCYMGAPLAPRPPCLWVSPGGHPMGAPRRMQKEAWECTGAFPPAFRGFARERVCVRLPGEQSPAVHLAAQDTVAHPQRREQDQDGP